MDPSPHDIPESTWLSESTYVNLLCGFIIHILLYNNIYPSPHDIPEFTWLSESTYVNLLCGFILNILP